MVAGLWQRRSQTEGLTLIRDVLDKHEVEHLFIGKLTSAKHMLAMTSRNRLGLVSRICG